MRASKPDAPPGDSVSRRLAVFLAAAPAPQRAGLGLLLSLGRRPRGARLLERVPALDQLVCSTLGLARYDEEAVGRALGWEAATVVARGRALRRAEGRP